MGLPDPGEGVFLENTQEQRPWSRCSKLGRGLTSGGLHGDKSDRDEVVSHADIWGGYP